MSSSATRHYKLKEGKVQPKVELPTSERERLERQECDAADVVFIDTFEFQKEREFLHFKFLFPDTYYQWIDQVWRVLDERDGKEYIIYHGYQYCTQTIQSEAGKVITRPHSIDGYYGFHHKPQVIPKEFNPDGSLADADIGIGIKVYDIPWSKEAFDALIDSPENRGTTNHFALGIASTDASRDVPQEKSTCSIRNREDFSNHGFDETIKLAKSQLSTSTPSMGQIQKILDLRKRLEAEGGEQQGSGDQSSISNKNITVKAKPEDSKTVATKQTSQP